jgi:hypothetical protein
MAVNNLDNAFTPQGTLDPLSSLVTFGVAIFQAVTPREIRTLIVRNIYHLDLFPDHGAQEAVTLTSKRAIAFGHPDCDDATWFPKQAVSEGPEDRRIFASQPKEGSSLQTCIPADLFPTTGDPADFVVLHDNTDLRSVALHPSFDRTTIKDGRMVARRRKWRWISGRSN